MVATLGGAHWHGIGTEIDKAVSLREVFNASQLLATATQVRINSLLGIVRIDDARKYVAEVAPRVSELLFQIEDFLRPIWEQKLQEQVSFRLKHKAGDILWREKIGWAVCLADVDSSRGLGIKVRLRGVESEVTGGFYVNVSDLMLKVPALNELLSSVRAECSVAA